MRIDNLFNLGNVAPVRRRTVDAAEAPSTPGVDSASFSGRSEDVRIAMDALKDAPEVDEERVAELRSQVEQGTFSLQPGDLADKLLGAK